MYVLDHIKKIKVLKEIGTIIFLHVFTISESLIQKLRHEKVTFCSVSHIYHTSITNYSLATHTVNLIRLILS